MLLYQSYPVLSRDKQGVVRFLSRYPAFFCKIRKKFSFIRTEGGRRRMTDGMSKDESCGALRRSYFRSGKRDLPACGRRGGAGKLYHGTLNQFREANEFASRNGKFPHQTCSAAENGTCPPAGGAVARTIPPKHSRLASLALAILLVLSLARLRFFSHRERSSGSPFKSRFFNRIAKEQAQGLLFCYAENGT